MDGIPLLYDRLRLEIKGVSSLSVERFRVHERIGEPTEIEVAVWTDQPIDDLGGLTTVAAKLWVTQAVPSRGAVQRLFTGVVVESSLRHVETAEQRYRYAFTIASDITLLHYRTNSRIFQYKSELEIVEALLTEWEIPFIVELDRADHPRRKYRAQHAESDYHFLHRMLEDAGVAYVFRVVDDRSVMVLSDAWHMGDERQPPLVHRADRDGLVRSLDYAGGTQEHHEVAQGRHVVRDSDHRRASTHLPEEACAEEGCSLRHESYHFIPGGFLYDAGSGDGATPLADAKGATRTSPRSARAFVQRRLEAQRALSRRYTFATNALDVQPSTLVTIVDDPHLEEQRLLVLGVAIGGERDGEWTIAVVAVPTHRPYRPALASKRPRVLGLEPATVVGPAGEEIHTDEFGRVKVQFHWDRYGQADDDSSCWVPVSSGWAGAAYGSIMLPRVGHEVLVEFLGGDPDRPMITGRVYGHNQSTPYKLPDEKSVTVLAKTQSLGGSGGYNEIKADDRAGAELLYARAERDLETLVQRQERRTIGEKRITRIGDSEVLDVGGNRQVKVAGQEQRHFTSPKPDAPRTVQTNECGRNKLEVGGSTVEVTPDKIVLKAPIVEIHADVFITFTKYGMVQSEGNLDLKTTGGDVNVTSSGDTNVKGACIKLNC